MAPSTGNFVDFMTLSPLDKCNDKVNFKTKLMRTGFIHAVMQNSPVCFLCHFIYIFFKLFHEIHFDIETQNQFNAGQGKTFIHRTGNMKEGQNIQCQTS